MRVAMAMRKAMGPAGWGCLLAVTMATLTMACAARPVACPCAPAVAEVTPGSGPAASEPAVVGGTAGAGGAAGDALRSSPEWRDYAAGRATLGGFENFAPALRPIEAGALDQELLAATLFYCTNAERVRNGRTAFAWSGALGRAAERYSTDMACEGFFSHQHPSDASRRTFVDRLRCEGVALDAAAENIAEWRVGESETYLDFARRVVRLWMDSAVHRTNILGRAYAYLGVGVCESGGAGGTGGTGGTGGKIYATQEFSSVGGR